MPAAPAAGAATMNANSIAPNSVKHRVFDTVLIHTCIDFLF